jgi:hypothetical protein
VSIPTLNPGGSRHAGDSLPLRVVKGENGIYSVKNAYSGTLEYFKGRPLPKLDPPNRH